MATLIDMPEQRSLEEAASAPAVFAMGRRLAKVYLEGAIPYLREAEPELWRELDALDRDESGHALAAYERLFLDGLGRYLAALRRAA